MITQTTVFTRPDTSLPWMNDDPAMQDYLAPRDGLVNSRPDLVSQAPRVESPDGLTCTTVQTFPSIDEYNTYVALLKQAIPGWPVGRNQYFTDRGHTINIRVTGDGVNIVYTAA